LKSKDDSGQGREYEYDDKDKDLKISHQDPRKRDNIRPGIPPENFG